MGPLFYMQSFIDQNVFVQCFALCSIPSISLSLCSALPFAASLLSTVTATSPFPWPHFQLICILTRCWWLTPVILATQEAEIRRIAVWSQPRQIVCETMSWKNPSQKRAGGVTQVVEHLPSNGEALSSNPSTIKKKKCLLKFFLTAAYC
jgi:hypothetical protein